MYHIKNDARSKKSANKIVEAFSNCLKTTEYEQLTVVQIQKCSGVGRTTFYRLFDNISDILVYQIDKAYDEFFGDNIRQYKDPLEQTLVFVMKNTDILNNILLCNRLDLIRKKFVVKKDNIIALHSNDEKLDVIQIDYDTCIFSGIVIGSLMAWYQNGEKESVKEVYNRLKASLNGINSTI